MRLDAAWRAPNHHLPAEKRATSISLWGAAAALLAVVSPAGALE